MPTDDAVSLKPWLDVLHASHQRLSAIVTPLTSEQVQAPSYDSEWSIAQVMSHLGSGAEIFGMFLDAGLNGTAMPTADVLQPLWQRWDAKAPHDQASDGLRSDAAFLRRVDDLDATQVDGWQLDMFGGVQPLPSLLRFRLAEHTVHSWDVAVALDSAATLSSDGVELMIDTLGQLVAMAGKPPVEPLAVHITTVDPTRHFRLTSTTESISLDGQATDSPTTGDASLRLPAEAMIRLAYGRLDPQHTPPLTADGIDIDLLRTTFPGV